MPEALVKYRYWTYRTDETDGAFVPLSPPLLVSLSPCLFIPAISSYFSFAVFVFFIVIVVFDGAHERAADWSGHPRIRPVHRHPDDLVEFDVGQRVFFAEIPGGRLLRARRVYRVPLGQII